MATKKELQNKITDLEQDVKELEEAYGRMSKLYYGNLYPDASLSTKSSPESEKKSFLDRLKRVLHYHWSVALDVTPWSWRWKPSWYGGYGDYQFNWLFLRVDQIRD